jgi:hypothetical protein
MRVDHFFESLNFGFPDSVTSYLALIASSYTDTSNKSSISDSALPGQFASVTSFMVMSPASIALPSAPAAGQVVVKKAVTVAQAST